MISRFKEVLPTWQDFKGTLPYQLFFFFLLFSQVYYSYRYLLSYGSTGTSPTDQNTPLSFQLPKYFVAGVIYLAIIAVIFLGKGYWGVIKAWFISRRWGIILTIFLTAYFTLSLVKFHPDIHDFSYQQLVKLVAFMPAALLPLIIAERDRILPTLLKVLNLAFVYQVLGFILVYLIFVTTGHTPAQAYQGSMVRFGGIWDDPNALGMFILIPLLTYLSLPSKVQEKYRTLIYLATGSAAAMIFLTLSLTAWSMLALGLLILFIFRRDSFTVKNIVLVAVIFAALSAGSPYSKNVLEFKAASVLARVGIHYQVGGGGGENFSEYIRSGQVADALKVQLGDVIANFNHSSIPHKVVLALFGPSPRPIFDESFYLLTLLNYGLIGLGALITLFLLTFRQAWLMLRSRSEELRSLGLAAFLITVAVGFGLSALPYLAIFPVGTYLLLVLVLTVANGERG